MVTNSNGFLNTFKASKWTDSTPSWNEGLPSAVKSLIHIFFVLPCILQSLTWFSFI